MAVPEKYHSWLVFVLSLVVCTSFIGSYPIYILDEARNAEAAREMYATGEYIVPYFNGELRSDKPPLHYYFMNLGYHLFGVNAFGARFFSGVFGALTILVSFISVRKWLGAKEGYITALILLSSLFFIQEFHLAVPDPYLIFFVSASLFAFYEFYKTNRKKFLFLAYASIGLGILTKGPIAILIPGMTIVLFLLLKKDFTLKRIISFRPVLGLLFSLTIAFPWYYMVHEATEGEWTTGFFLEHNINRFKSEKEGHGGLFFLTPLFVVLGLLPFSFFIIQGFSNAWRKRFKNDLVLFAIACAIVTVIFFSLASTKLPNYPMLCYPFVAIILATYFNHIWQGSKDSKTVQWSLRALIFLSLVLPIGAYLALSIERQFVELTWLSFLFLITTIASVVSWYCYKKSLLQTSFVSLAIGWILMGFALFGMIYPALTQKSPVTLASNLIKEDSNVVVFQRFDSAFPINFKRTFEVVETLDEVNTYFKNNPEAYLLTNTRDKDSLQAFEQIYELVLEQKALFENHTTRIYRK